jgi:hypothetical protein
MAKNAAMEEVDEVQTEMFPELDEGNAKHKQVLRAAKRYAKAKAERDQVLSSAKEKQDATMENLIALMHECNLMKFKYDGVRAEILVTKEKAQVRLEDDASGDDEE